MKITNKDVIQSYLLTTARYDFDVYEKRILYRLVELGQNQLEGKKLERHFELNKDLFGGGLVKIPISSLLKNEEDKNHFRVKKALEKLREKVFEYEDAERWELISIIESPAIEKYHEYVEFRIHPKIYAVIFDFSKGFRKYELATAMNFKSTYAMRFYELFSGKKSPIVYSVEHLKIMFKIENKYKQINDFIKRVIISAKQELDKKSPYSFEYELVKEGRKVIAIKFHPYFIPENRDESLETKHLQSQISPAWDLDKITIDYLKQNYYFDTGEINRNIELFKEAEQKLDLLLFLSDMRTKCENKANPKGYLINALKTQLNNITTKPNFKLN